MDHEDKSRQCLIPLFRNPDVARVDIYISISTYQYLHINTDLSTAVAFFIPGATGYLKNNISKKVKYCNKNTIKYIH